MDTVLVGASLRSDAGIGLSCPGAVILLMGAVLVDMNFGGSSAGAAAGFLFKRIEGGTTDLEAEGEGAGAGDPEEGIRGFSLIVFLAAEEAEARLDEAGIRFKAAVSVLRISSGALFPPWALLSVSAVIKILFRNS